MEAHPSGRWHGLLRQAVEEHALEVGDGEIPVSHFIEWLAEWGRDIRRRQRGLLLLTGHGAKGLEFDHVAVLDGGWDRVNPDEDPDAPRRLYYVAMTRARMTLILAKRDGSWRLCSELLEHPSVVVRELPDFPPGPPELEHRHIRVGLKDVDLGFSGRRSATHSIHRTISALSSGDPLKTRISSDGRWELLNLADMVIGRLAKSFMPPPGTRCRTAAVRAVVRRSREETPPEYRDPLCDAWEVVVPELTFEPDI